MFVIYHSSDSFANVTGISMISLFENNKHMDRIRVLYIEKGVSDNNKRILKSITEKYNREIEFLEMPNWSSKLNIELNSCKSGWLGFGYNRLFLTEIVPEDVDKVLYLDSDTIIEGSLDELWNIDLNNYYLAAVDDCLSSKYRKIVGIAEDGTYCNSGVLLINIKKWREENIIEEFKKILYANKGCFVFNEQSVINSLFSGKIKIIHQKYNVNSLVFLFEYDELIRLRKPYKFSYSKEQLEEAKKNPVITHFTGNFFVTRRPWVENSDHPHRSVYDYYKSISPWKELPYHNDVRSKSARIFTYVCKLLPRKLMIFSVSFIYNRLRPIMFNKRVEKMRRK